MPVEYILLGLASISCLYALAFIYPAAFRASPPPVDSTPPSERNGRDSLFGTAPPYYTLIQNEAIMRLLKHHNVDVWTSLPFPSGDHGPRINSIHHYTEAEFSADQLIPRMFEARERSHD